jgi:hypothetical protein
MMMMMAVVVVVVVMIMMVCPLLKIKVFWHLLCIDW